LLRSFAWIAGEYVLSLLIIFATGGLSGERDYLQFGAQLAYALSRTLSVEADYRYTDTDRGLASGAAESNNLFVWLLYRPNAWSASR